MLPYKRVSNNTTVRRGAVAPLVAVASVVLVGMGALAIDTGILYRARAELQTCADASALAAASELLDEDRLRGAPNITNDMDAGRTQAIAYAARNPVLGASPTLDGNAANSPNGDVVFGYLNNPNDLKEALSFSPENRFNTVLVRVRRNETRNGPVELLFANVFGMRTVNLGAEAAAVIKDGAVGFRSPDSSKNIRCPLLPLAVVKSSWDAYLAKTMTNGDSYSYNSTTKTVSSGSDSIPELVIYPGAASGSKKVEPGNFGTVDIGNPNNSTCDLARQIRYGPNADDLAYFGGEVKLGSNGTLILNGDTGLSASIKDDLEAIKGQPRVIPLFSSCSGNGAKAMFTVVGFAGVRVVHVQLTGSNKEVRVQPAFVVNETVITGSGSGNSSFVYEPVRLVR